MTSENVPNPDVPADAATTTMTNAAVTVAPHCATKACGMTGAFGKVPLILVAIAGLGFAGFQGYTNRVEWAAAISGEPLMTAKCGRVGGTCCNHSLSTENEAAEAPQVASAGLPEFGTCCSMLPGAAAVADATMFADEPVSALVPLNVATAPTVEVAEPTATGTVTADGVAL